MKNRDGSLFKRRKAKFGYYLINWKLFNVVTLVEAMTYEFPDEKMKIKDMWKWCKEGKE